MKKSLTRNEFEKTKTNPIGLNFSIEKKSPLSKIFKFPTTTNSNNKSLISNAINKKTKKNSSIIDKADKREISIIKVEKNHSDNLTNTLIKNGSISQVGSVNKVSSLENITAYNLNSVTETSTSIDKFTNRRDKRFGTIEARSPKLSMDYYETGIGSNLVSNLGSSLGGTYNYTQYADSFRKTLKNYTTKVSGLTQQHQNVLKKKVKVIVRFRQLSEIEDELMKNNVGYICPVFPQEDTSYHRSIFLSKNESLNENTPFSFDRVFPMESQQEEIYNFIGVETVEDVLSGYNATLFTYGQSGSGKTYTMYGNDIYDEVNRGIIPRIISQIFEAIDKSDGIVFQVKLSILQIYKEIISDLLTGEKDLRIKENPIRGIYVEGLTEVFVDSAESFLNYVELSQQMRVISETKLNKNSSRSHSILMLEITQTTEKSDGENFTKKGVLNLVDLAGSEKVSKTGAVGETLEEAKKINLSLSALGNVIHALTSISADNKNSHIPYRDSKLTRLLQESLGGNYKTSIIVTCSPHSYHLEETISSLKFAQRAKTIKNKVKMNIKLSYEELQKVINSLKGQIEYSNAEVCKLKEIVNNKNEIITVTDDFFETREILSKFPNDECEACKDKNETLNFQIKQIKEKDEIIANLEKEILIYKENSRDSEDIEKHKKISDLYDDIKNTLEKLIADRGTLTKIEKDKNYLELCTTEKINNIDKQNFYLNDEKEKLDTYNSLFKSVNFSFVIESYNKMNAYIETQNDNLQKENTLLLNTVEDLLKSNYELSNNFINLNANMVNNIYQNFKNSIVIPDQYNNHIRSSNNLNFAFTNELNPLSKKFKKLPISKKPSLKIETFISKRNINIIKNMQYTNNTNNNMSDTDSVHNFNIKSSTSGKKLSQLKELQDFRVKSIRESESIKNSFRDLQERFMTLINNNILSGGEREIKNIINSYIETGTVTRRFDGIGLKYEGNTMKWYYSGGLNCQNKITKGPILQHLEKNDGDSSVRIEDSIIMY